MVITQSLLHVGELCEGTTGGNEGRTGPGEWGKKLRHALQWWRDGMVGMGDMTSCRGGNMR